MPDYSEEAWQRLGEAVRRERARLGFDQADAKPRSGGRIARATWSNIERGIPGNYSDETLLGLCIALQWSDDSVTAILEGGEPKPTLRLGPATSGGARDAALSDKMSKLSPEDRRYVEGIIDGLLRDE